MIRNMNSLCRREGRPPVAVVSGGGRSSHLFATIILLSGLIFALSCFGMAWGEPTLLWRIPDHHAFSKPEGVVVAPDGAVLVTDNGNHQIVKIDQSTRNSEVGFGSYGSGDGQFNYPLGVAVDSSGNVYVADAYNDRIQKFNGSGSFIVKWGTYGSGDGQFNYPGGVAVDSSGNVYVADWGNDRIQKFNGSGSFIGKWGTSGSGDGQFNYPGGVAVDSSDNVYVADTLNHRIQKFGPLNNCAATLANDLSLLHIPILTFNDAKYWADFQYVPNTTFDFTIINANIVTDTSPYSSCPPASLSSDFTLHMPTVMFNGASYWLDLQYTGGFNFTFVTAGAN